MSWIRMHGSRLMDRSRFSCPAMVAPGAWDLAVPEDAQLSVLITVLCAFSMLILGSTVRGSSRCISLHRCSFQTVQDVSRSKHITAA